MKFVRITVPLRLIRLSSTDTLVQDKIFVHFERLFVSEHGYFYLELPQRQPECLLHYIHFLECVVLEALVLVKYINRFHFHDHVSRFQPIVFNPDGKLLRAGCYLFSEFNLLVDCFEAG